jgi:hypothetical protein
MLPAEDFAFLLIFSLAGIDSIHGKCRDVPRF